MNNKYFEKIISDIVINFEKAGVKDETLQTSIDRLFELKDIIYLRNNIKDISKDRPECRKCIYNDNNSCNKLTYEIWSNNKLCLFNTIKVNPFWSCSFFKLPQKSDS